MSAYSNIFEIKSKFDHFYNSDRKNKVVEISNNDGVVVFEKYDNRGALMLRGEAFDGKIHGRGIVFYKNGNVHCIMNYRDGELDGVAHGYYINGSLALEIFFKMGKAVSGFYYKKSGRKASMTPSQLDRKTKDAL